MDTRQFLAPQGCSMLFSSQNDLWDITHEACQSSKADYCVWRRKYRFWGEICLCMCWWFYNCCLGLGLQKCLQGAWVNGYKRCRMSTIGGFPQLSSWYHHSVSDISVLLNKAICCTGVLSRVSSDVLWPNFTKTLRSGSIPLALAWTQREHMCV